MLLTSLLGSCPCELIEEGCARTWDYTLEPGHAHVSVGKRRRASEEQAVTLVQSQCVESTLCPVLFLLYSGDQSHVLNWVFPSRFESVSPWSLQLLPFPLLSYLFVQCSGYFRILWGKETKQTIYMSNLVSS